MIAMSTDGSEIVPALAGADGTALVRDDGAAEVDPVEVTLDVTIAATLNFAAIWPLRSGPFFSCDGQLAALIAAEFGADAGASAST
jgi:hypothetical protein